MDFILDPGLVLYLPLYELDGASLMSKDAYGHLAAVTGALWTPQGRTFDGTDDVIIVPHNAAFNFGTGDFSFHIWFKGITEDGGSILGKVSNGSNFFHLIRSGTILRFQFYVANIEDVVSSTTSINDTTWRLASVSRLSGTLKLYINGIEEGSVASTKSMNYTGDLAIGRGYTSSFANTTIGEVLVYNRALSAGEAQQNYLRTRWRYL